MGLGNIGDLMRAKGSVEAFLRAHPRLPAYCEAVAKEGVRPGSVIDIRFTSPEGKEIETNFLVKESDLVFLKLMKSMMDSMRPEGK